MQFLLFKEEKFYALCTLKDKNFAPKQNERDCPMTFIWLNEVRIYACSKQICLEHGNDLATFFRYSLSKLFYCI